MRIVYFHFLCSDAHFRNSAVLKCSKGMAYYIQIRLWQADLYTIGHLFPSFSLGWVLHFKKGQDNSRQKLELLVSAGIT